MTFTVLSNDQTNAILESLSLDELDDFRLVLASALHEFSTNADEAFQQPHRTSTLHSDTGATTLYMPSCGPSGMGCKVVSLTSPELREDPTVTPISPTGVVNLFNPDGTPFGLIHASALTAFRTALASTCLLARRNHVRTITVFGSGLQAYWHVRLALMMRGSTIKHVNVINRRFSSSATGILKKFATIPIAVKEREGWARTKFGLLTPTFKEYPQMLKQHVRDADVIYCCTPSQVDLFDGSILTSHEGRKKGRLIVAIGSYRPGMRELPEDLLQLAVKQEKPHRHFHKHAIEGGAIVVDTLEGALKEAGEIISAKIGPHQLVELGELVMLHRLALEESDVETPSSRASLSEEMDRIDLNDKGSSMSSVFNSGGAASEPRPSSPTGSIGSGSGTRTPNFPFHHRTKSSSSTGNSSSHERKKEGALVQWLREGTVIYKSVGLGLMDLVVGMHLVEVANKKNIGSRIEGF
ncbi:hypothetical protein G7046_g3563 [Stylonectria norvegica]|nr:hypothetical protein G7046_g3563 [Stylonectria norvegica]